MTDKVQEDDWKSTTTPTLLQPVANYVDEDNDEDEDANAIIYTETDLANNIVDVTGQVTQTIYRFCDEKALTICEYLSGDSVFEFIQNHIQF